MIFNLFHKNYSSLILFILLSVFLFPRINFAKISDKNAIKTFWQEAPIMPGAAKYFIRTEKIEKKTKSLNNHPIKIPEVILRKMLKQLSYKYDRDQPEIPLFSNKELTLLSEYVPVALMTAKPNEDITFVIKGPHGSARWILQEDRLTSGRIFVSNNQLNIILGTVQANLQPTLDERYQGNVWETTKVIYDLGYRKKIADYEGLIVIFDQKQKGIYRKSSKRKELEIVDLLNIYLKNKSLKSEFMGRGSAWLDTGNATNLFNASQYIAAIEERQGLKIACIEEISYQNKWISKKQILKRISFYGKCDYSDYLKKIL